MRARRPALHRRRTRLPRARSARILPAFSAASTPSHAATTTAGSPRCLRPRRRTRAFAPREPVTHSRIDERVRQRVRRLGIVFTARRPRGSRPTWRRARIETSCRGRGPAARTLGSTFITARRPRKFPSSAGSRAFSAKRAGAMTPGSTSLAACAWSASLDDALAADPNAFAPRPGIRRSDRRLGQSEDRGGLVRSGPGRQLHEAARLGRNRHPAARRVRDRLHRQPAILSLSEAAASMSGSIRRSLDGRGLLEATAFFNDYDDLIVAVGSLSGCQPLSHRQHLECSSARASSSREPARIRWSTSVPVDLQIRIGYTLLDTEILAVDRDRAHRSPVRARRPPAAPAAAPVRDRRHARRAAAWSRFSMAAAAAARSTSTRRSAPSAGCSRARGYNVWNTGASWRIARGDPDFRPRRQPLRSPVRGSARFPGASARRDRGSLRLLQAADVSFAYDDEPVLRRRIARRAGRRLRRHPRPERLRQNHAAAAARRNAPAGARHGDVRRRDDLRALPRTRSRNGSRSCRRKRTSRSTTRVLEVVLMGRYPHLGAFEIEGPADLAIAREALAATGTRRSRTGRSRRSAAAKSSA